MSEIPVTPSDSQVVVVGEGLAAWVAEPARSIPDILRWEPADDNEVTPTWWAGGHLRDRWTVDDLLTWLRGQGAQAYGGHVGQYDDVPITDTPVTLAVYYDPGGPWTVNAPTLLAALEAAVRAVAGEL